MQQRRVGLGLCGVLGCVLVSACAGSDAAGAGGGVGGNQPHSGSGGTGGTGALGGTGFGGGGFGGVGGAGGAGFFDGGLPPLPPEMELSANFELPRAGDRFVYAANPAGDTVAVIDATNLRISTIEAGDQPTFLQTLVGTDNAIVLNVGSNDATLIRATETAITRSTVRVVPGANAIAVAPDGKHAVVYYDSAYTSAAGSSGSFQDVTVIRIDDTGDTGVSLTVGFRPSAVFHQADGSRSFVVTEDGVSILDYATIDQDGAGIAPTIPTGDVGVGALDVSVTADGKYALARGQNNASLRLIDLNTRAITTLPLTSALLRNNTDDADAGVSELPEVALVVTDLDLAPDGRSAFAVIRDASSVLALPIPEAFTDPTTIATIHVPGQVVGSVTIADDGRRALLYTTAWDQIESVTVINLEDISDAPRTVALRKAVKAIAISPDGENALVVHKKLDGSPDQVGLTEDEKIDRRYGYSVINLATHFAKLQVTDTEVGPFSIVPDGNYLFLLFNTEPSRLVQRVNLRNFLVDGVALGSRPVSIGAVEQSHKVFVSQEHADGRITFIDWTAESLADATESVTGFELNSRIRQ